MCVEQNTLRIHMVTVSDVEMDHGFVVSALQMLQLIIDAHNMR